MLDRQRVRTFLLGGLAGVVAGLLFAPRSGRETRGSLYTGAGTARERGRETLFETRERLEERLAARRYRLPEGGRAPVTPRAAAPGGAQAPDDPQAAPPETRPHLHEVPPRDPGAGEDAAARGEMMPDEAADPEELRRRISQTRSRLRERLRRDGPAGGEETEHGEDV
jgi:hypothetical protein